jgi:endonuclease/exonuclease/phosphatase family metal-dependent hydrolase
MKTQSLMTLFWVGLLSACSATNSVINSNNEASVSETRELSPVIVQSQASLGNPLYRQSLVTPDDYQYPQQKTFKVISWNVEHFVDAYDDPYIQHEREDNSAQSMGNKRAYLVEALKMANADIVVLQEFESAKLLRDIAQNDLADMGYVFFADAPSHGWYMNVVVMSRFPLGVMYSYGNANTAVLNYVDEDGNTETQRNLNTRAWSIDVFPSETYSFLMTSVHLKAGRGERNVGMRLGQIKFLKTQFERFLWEDPNRNILIVGDFNALPETIELNTLLSGTHSGNSFTDPLGPEDFTHTAIEPLRRLDYILMNGNMLQEMVPDSVKPVYYFAPQKQDDVADHLPVVAEFYIQDR